jgi:outer membrane receptor protein involved in Fe transport
LQEPTPDSGGVIMRNALLPPILLSAIAGHCPAAEEDLFALSLEELGRVEIHAATGTPKPLATAPAGASIITSSDLDALAGSDIIEALEAIPGLHVSRGSLFQAPRFFIRGITSSYNPHTLVLVNGMPMTSLLFGDRVGLQQWLPAIESVDRIEIIRGPGSATHGADAFAGVINVITRRPEQINDTEVHAQHGSFDSTRLSLVSGFESGALQTSLVVAYNRTDGDDPLIPADAQTGIDALMAPFGVAPASRAPGPLNLGARNFEARLDMEWHSFRWQSAFNQVSRQETGLGLADALDPYGQWGNHLFSTDLEWQPVQEGHWQLGGRVNYLYASVFADKPSELSPPGADFGAGSFPDGVLGQPEYREESARVELSATYNGWNRHRIRLGTGFHWGDLFQTKGIVNFDLSSGIPVPLPGGLTDVSDTPAIFQPEAQRTDRHFFVQDEWTFAPDWELTSGLRHDYYSDIGETVNPRLALVWTSTPWLSSKLLYGEAFRPPAFSELYSTNNPVFLGNPSLSPERLKSLELAFSLLPSEHWSADLNVYRLDARDFIDFVQDPGGSFTARNTGRVHGEGVEMEVRWQPVPAMQWMANYSYQDTRTRQTDQPLGMTPRDQATLRLRWTPAPRWHLLSQVTWVGKRLRNAGDMRDDLDGYTSVDLTLRHIRFQERMAIALVTRNLFDTDIREPSRGPGPGQPSPTVPDDLPQAGRSIELDARFRF